MDNEIPMMLAEDLVRRKGTYFVVKPCKIGFDKVVSGHYKKDTATDKASGQDDLVVWEQVGDWDGGEAFLIDFNLIE